MDPKLLEILRCPVSGAKLAPLPEDSRRRLNAAIARGTVRYADGSAVEQPLDAGLTTGDGATVYRIDDGIPVMLAERRIATPTDGAA